MYMYGNTKDLSSSILEFGLVYFGKKGSELGNI
jgi:hypothetical protein